MADGKTIEDIFLLMKDEFHCKKAESVYFYIESKFEDIEIVSIKNCISIA